MKQKWIAIVAAGIVALAGCIGTFQEFPWNKHDLEVASASIADGSLSFQVTQDHKACVLEIALHGNKSHESLVAKMGKVQLYVEHLTCQNDNCVEVIRIGEEPSSARSWDWPATDTLVIRDQESIPVKMNNWKLRCADGTDSSRDAFLRVLLLWSSVSLSILAVLLAIYGAWKTTGEHSKTKGDPIDAILDRISVPELAKEELDLLKGIILMSLRAVDIKDLTHLIAKVGGGSWSQGIIYFRQAYKQVEFDIIELKEKLDSVDPTDPVFKIPDEGSENGA